MRVYAASAFILRADALKVKHKLTSNWLVAAGDMQYSWL